MKPSASIKEQFQKQVLVYLQNPATFRTVIVILLALAGIGGIGVPLYMSIEEYKQQNLSQKERTALLKEYRILAGTLREMDPRISGYTAFVDWIAEYRTLVLQCDLQIMALTHALLKSDPKGLQRLKIESRVRGSYENILKLMGILNYRQHRLHIAEWTILHRKGNDIYEVSISLTTLMRPPRTTKKKDAKKSAESKAEIKILKTSHIETEEILTEAQQVSTQSAETEISTAAVASALMAEEKKNSAVSKMASQLRTGIILKKLEKSSSSKTTEELPAATQPAAITKKHSAPSGKFAFEEEDKPIPLPKKDSNKSGGSKSNAALE